MKRFINTKKGFTLVELMIVVVIMAILVAVAVPIYTAVTAKAAKKSCVGNQRTIMEMLVSYGMSNTDTPLKDGTIKITSNAAGDGYSELDTGDVCTQTAFIGMFQKMPYCPKADQVITVTVTKLATNGYQISAECTMDGHEYVPQGT